MYYLNTPELVPSVVLVEWVPTDARPNLPTLLRVP